MHAYALESLSDFLGPGMKALDVGSGSGYLTACMARMVIFIISCKEIDSRWKSDWY